MKRFLVVLFAGLVLASLASASSLYYYECTVTGGGFPAEFTGGNGTATSNCPAAPVLPLGDVYTAVILWDTADYQFGLTPTNEVQMAETPNSGTWAASGWVSPTVTCDVAGTGSSNVGPCTPTGTYAPSTSFESLTLTGAALQTFAMGGFSVTDVSTVMTGTVAMSAIGNFVEYDYAPASTVPEPATPAAVGGAFLALAALARKRRS
jgi:hypothetical protein